MVVFLKASVGSQHARLLGTDAGGACGYYGCMTDMQSYLVTAVEVRAKAELTVYEGPTARVLQTERFEGSAVGEDPKQLQESAVELLARELERSVDVLSFHPRFELYRVNMPEVKAAIEAIRSGDWSKGREQLERAAKRLGGHKKKNTGPRLVRPGARALGSTWACRAHARSLRGRPPRALLGAAPPARAAPRGRAT